MALAVLNSIKLKKLVQTNCDELHYKFLALNIVKMSLADKNERNRCG
jgi:hypothetical protein